jgi:hypothetical protein
VSELSVSNELWSLDLGNLPKRATFKTTDDLKADTSDRVAQIAERYNLEARNTEPKWNHSSRNWSTYNQNTFQYLIQFHLQAFPIRGSNTMHSISHDLEDKILKIDQLIKESPYMYPDIVNPLLSKIRRGKLTEGVVHDQIALLEACFLIAIPNEETSLDENETKETFNKCEFYVRYVVAALYDLAETARLQDINNVPLERD